MSDSANSDAKAVLPNTGAPRPRPLSPHISIYRKQITSVMSILHRITGVILSGGLLLIAAWLGAAAYSAECFESMHNFLSASLGRAFMIAWTLTFFYHLNNGLRHLWWDMGKGMDMPSVYKSGYAAFLASILATGGLWIFIMNNNN